MSIPAFCAARMIVSPGSKGISRSSILKVGITNFRKLESCCFGAGAPKRQRYRRGAPWNYALRDPRRGTLPWLRERSSRLAVALSANHVQGTEARNRVGHHGARDHALEPGGDEEARRANAHAVRRPAAVAHQVEAELAVAAFTVGVNLTGRQFQAFHHDFEVLDGA